MLTHCTVGTLSGFSLWFLFDDCIHWPGKISHQVQVIIIHLSQRNVGTDLWTAHTGRILINRKTSRGGFFHLLTKKLNPFTEREDTTGSQLKARR